MNSKSPIPRIARARRQHAFTLVELLVLLGVILLFGLIQLTALARAKGHTTRAQCVGNLKEFAAGLHMFAAENNGDLPNNLGGGSWAHSMPPTAGTFIEQTGSHWSIMYCPGRSHRFTTEDNFLLYNYTSGYRVLGYAVTFTNTTTLAAANQNGSLTPPRIQVAPGMIVIQRAAERVLLADMTISPFTQKSRESANTYNWTSIQGGFYKPHTTAHMAGRIPAGGNLAMLDGHVEWRDFKDMLPRTTGTSPTFWW